MSKNFKYIISCIIICLCLVFAFQLFWLKGLYNTIKKETESTIVQSIKEASVVELDMRVDSLDSVKDKEEERSFAINLTTGGGGGDDDDKERGITKKKTSVYKNDTTSSKETVENDSEKQNIIWMLNIFEKELTEAIHQVVDTISPIKLAKVDSILTEKLKAKNIDTKIYTIQNKDIEKNKIIDIYGEDLSLKDKGETFLFTYQSENPKALVVTVAPLTKDILRQMSGILGTTLLIVILLGISFWYLIKTIFAQKSLEEMKDDFTNNMTHELKTPIAVAYSATDALLNFGVADDKEKRNRYLNICKDQLTDLTALVEKILTMSMERRKTFTINKEEIETEELINKIIEQHKLKAKKPVQFSLEIKPNDLKIFADRTHINNLISNLIDNAIKYSKDSVNISISVTHSSGADTITIADNGIGIDREKLQYIFDKFYRVTSGNKYTVKGYGLGLFYVKSIVDKHNGTIDVKSMLGGGTTFTITLPTE